MPGYDPDLEPVIADLRARLSSLEGHQATTDSRLTSIAEVQNAHAKTLDEMKAGRPDQPTEDPDTPAEPDPVDPDPVEPPTGDYRVTSRAELSDALARATGGETIIVADGDYGSWSIDDAFTAHVTIKAEGSAANFGDMDMDGSANVRLEGLSILATSGIAVSGDDSEGLEVIGCRIGGKPGAMCSMGARVRSGSRSKFIGNIVTYCSGAGIAHFGSTDIELRANITDHMGADDYKFGGCTKVRAIDNFGSRTRDKSDGAHADVMQFQGEPSRDVVVRGTVIMPAAGTIATHQGIFFNTKQPCEDVLIEQNIVIGALVRGISIEDGKNVTIRNNTVLDVDGQGAEVTRVIAPAGAAVEGNIWTDKAGEVRGSNVLVTHGGGAFGTATLFADYPGTGAKPEGLLPKTPGNLIDGKGAVVRLGELLG